MLIYGNEKNSDACYGELYKQKSNQFTMLVDGVFHG